MTRSSPIDPGDSAAADIETLHHVLEIIRDRAIALLEIKNADLRREIARIRAELSYRYRRENEPWRRGGAVGEKT